MEQVSSRVVYADHDGSVHMCLPIYVDIDGGCHAICEDICPSNEDSLMSSICDSGVGSNCSSSFKQRMVERVMQQVLQLDDDVIDEAEANLFRKHVRYQLFKGSEALTFDEKGSSFSTTCSASLMSFECSVCLCLLILDVQMTLDMHYSSADAYAEILPQR